MSLHNPVIQVDLARMPKNEGLGGMTLRDYFAGQALAGYLAVPDERCCPPDRTSDREAWRNEVLLADAKYLYRYADAMLKAREQ